MIAQTSEHASRNGFGNHLIVDAVGISWREVPDAGSTGDKELVHSIEEAADPDKSKDKCVELFSYFVSPCYISVWLTIEFSFSRLSLCYFTVGVNIYSKVYPDE